MGACGLTPPANSVGLTVRSWQAVVYFALSPCGRGVAPFSSTLPTRRLAVPSPPHPNPLPQGEREPEVASAKRVIANSESVEGIISSEFRAGSASLNCQLVLALGRDTDESPDLGTVRRDHVQSIQSLSDMSDSRSAWRGCHSNAEAGSKGISAAGESCEDPGCSLSISESPVSTRIIKREVIQGVS